MKKIYYAIILFSFTCSFYLSCSRSGEKSVLHKQPNGRVETSPTKEKIPEPKTSPTPEKESISLKPELQPTITPQLPLSQKSKCDPNYSGCVPIASDVDCLDGDGDGPEYVKGPIEVIGYDKYKLDRDGNGIACE